MKRKINRVGTSTLTVSLPSKWARQQGLKPGDEVEVKEEGKSILLGVGEAKKEPRKISFKIEVKEENLVKSYLYAAYQLGFDEVELYFKYPQILSLINGRIGDLIGFEIVSQRENYCLIKNVASPLKESYIDLANKMFLLTITFSEEVLEALKNKQNNLLGRILIQERTQNKLYLACARILNEHGDSLTRHPSLVYYYLSELESIGDDIRFICEHYQNKKITISKESQRYFQEFISSLRETYSLHRKFELNTFTGLVHKRDNLLREGVKLLGQERDVVLISYLHSAILKLYDMIKNIFQANVG